MTYHDLMNLTYYDELRNVLRKMDRVTLFEEFRLIERSETEVNGVWKGAHLLLFFMAFVFGSFCTFCFHMLMYLFDEKCVLFPKLLSLTSSRHNVIYEFFPIEKETADSLPLDFLGTQWVEKSACYLPTYVPLMSGIFGLVWTTMFLMCSTGSRTLTGLQRPWRVLPPVFVFSLAMGCLCIYSSAVTHYGLNELCAKLGEITGSSTCTYTVNVATLAYERRIRGVYQAIKLTIYSAWLHTLCWLLSTLLTLARVILAVDFQLVRINVDLVGDIDKMLERHERQIRTVSPDLWYNNEKSSDTSLPTHVHFARKTYGAQTDDARAGPSSHSPTRDNYDQTVEVLFGEDNDVLYVSQFNQHSSEISLLPEERRKLSIKTACQNTPEEYHFIVKMLYNIVHNITLTDTYSLASNSGLELAETDSDVCPVNRQFGRGRLLSTNTDVVNQTSIAELNEAEETAKEIKRLIQEKLNEKIQELPIYQYEPGASTSAAAESTQNENNLVYESVLNITDELKRILEANDKLKLGDTELAKEEQQTSDDSRGVKKSNLKHASVQTDFKGKEQKQHVQISEPEDEENTPTGDVQESEKETQTSKKKEKQD